MHVSYKKFSWFSETSLEVGRCSIVKDRFPPRLSKEGIFCALHSLQQAAISD
jgi:hypothetical protein